MNKINMLKSVYFLYTQVPKEQFDMECYRRHFGNKDPDFKNPVCETIGCAAGWLTAIIPKEKILYHLNGNIYFHDTFESILSITHSKSDFLFSGGWKPMDNTLEGACKRFLYLLITKNPDLEIKPSHPYHKINIVSTYNKLKAEHEKSRKL